MSVSPAPLDATHEDVQEYISSVSPKGMITIPQEVRRAFNIQPKGQVVLRRKKDSVEIKPMMTLEETYGSVTPINRPENFKQLRDTAIDEKVDKEIAKLKL